MEVCKPKKSDDTEVSFIIEKRHCEKKVREAMKFELDQWKKYNVYEAVPDSGQPSISTRCTVSREVV